ncbi:hypothetical protein B0H10DRAFT_2214806 [Mycena sp. CBHHK59/15]|nr:hypothetical protein B0H10DRAFT_2214806 [Mycena sp. CBHHK59/15]
MDPPAFSARSQRPSRTSADSNNGVMSGCHSQSVLQETMAWDARALEKSFENGNCIDSTTKGPKVWGHLSFREIKTSTESLSLWIQRCPRAAVEAAQDDQVKAPYDPLQPTIHAEQGSELWHAITFQYLPWTLVQLGAKPRASTNAGRILTDVQLPWHSFTVAGFKAFKSCLTNPITSGKTYYLLGTYFPFLVVTPKYGPLTGRAPTQMVPYRCFLLCVLDPLSPTYDLAYPVDCFEDDECIVVGEASLTTANQSSSQHSSPRRTLARLAYSDADDADQDPDYLEALKRSMTDTGASQALRVLVRVVH